MPASVLFMSMSLDGFIADPSDALGGDDGMRLHEWAFTPDGESPRTAGPAGSLNEEIMATGAVVVGRRTAELMDHWGGSHHGVPIFVPSHRPAAPSVADSPMITYVTDGVASAMARAKAVAGDRDVLVHGAYTARKALEAGVLDQLQLDQVPVLFGRGLRLFDVLPQQIELEVARVIDTPAATHIRYRVRH